MGNFITSLFSGMWENKKARILVLGLDAAGKTTILYMLKLGEDVVTIPTIGFNVETVKYKKIDFTMWDVGCNERIRSLCLKHYLEGTDALIYVVDSDDRERMSEARDELHKYLSNEPLTNVPVLVLANKQDLPHSLCVAEVREQMNMHELVQKKWIVQPTCAKSGEGLAQGLDWLANQLHER